MSPGFRTNNLKPKLTIPKDLKEKANALDDLLDHILPKNSSDNSY
jgi:hypothetical protein